MILKCYKLKFSRNFALLHISYCIAATAAKRVKVDPHWHFGYHCI